MSRVIAINLDGFDFDIARALVAEGKMPELASLAEDANQFLLEHGDARSTGLAGEHVATGKTPEEMDNFAITHFDPVTYDTWMETTATPPFVASLGVPNVAFDMAYFKLEDAPNTMGMTYWGAHDLGCKPMARPASLVAEIKERFGAYKGEGFAYGFVYPSVEKTRQMGERLAAGVHQRAEVFEWLLTERFPDWQLAQVLVSEPHSGIEGLAHGVVPDHPQAKHPSAAIAREGIRSIYIACDALIGRLRKSFPDAKLVVFAMHGMGANESDVPTMALLAELLYKREFGRPLLDPARAGTVDPETGVMIPADPANWERSVRLGIDENLGLRRHQRRFDRWRARQRRDAHNERVERLGEGGYADSIDWIPASLYRPFWSRMKAFALPSFTDGEIRLNVKGRESRGVVPVEDYSATLDELAAFLMELIDPDTGESAVRRLEVDESRDPFRVGGRQADIRIIWRSNSTAFTHPDVGTVGPLPWRRVGGHTGGLGMALIDQRDSVPSGAEAKAAKGLLPPDSTNVRSAFDVAPTLLSLIGQESSGLAGKSLVD